MKYIDRVSVCAMFLLAALAPLHADPLAVGSKHFTESYVLGEIITQLADKVGETKAIHKPGLGSTPIVYQALVKEQIDLYPEYTGTIAQEILKDKTTGSIGELNAELAPRGLAIGVPFGFNDTYAFAMREDTAQKLGIRSISDLRKHPDLVLGLDHEFVRRADGWDGVKAAYGLPFSTPAGFDHALAYDALTAGRVDVVDVYSTDAAIERYHLRVLTDDRNYFPEYDAVLLYRRDVPTRFPRTWATLQTLWGRIDAKRMVELNAQVDLDKQTYSAVAANFLATDLGTGAAVSAANSSRGGLWAQTFGDDFKQRTIEHVSLVFISLVLGVIVGVPLGTWAARSSKTAPAILSTVGIIQTLPSLALLGFLVAFTGVGAVPAIIALFLYSLLPIVRNTYTGLTDISPALRESADALGLSPLAKLRLIELPLASRSILAGIKTSAVINVGTATIAALIGAGGYGQRILSGINVADNITILSGAIPAALLALVVQWGFDAVERVAVPAGLRR